MDKIIINDRFEIKGRGTVLITHKFDGWETIEELEAIGVVTGKFKILEREAVYKNGWTHESKNCGFIVEEIK